MSMDILDRLRSAPKGDKTAHVAADEIDHLRAELARHKKAGQDAERMDWLQEQAEKGCVSMCFEIDGGVHVTLDLVGEDQRAARNVNTVREGIDALRGEVKP